MAAGLGRVSTWAGVPVVVHFVLTAAVAIAAVVVAQRRFLPAVTAAPRDPDSAPVRGNALAAWLEPRTLLIGVLVLAAAFTEGSALDWLSVGIVDGYGAAPWVGVLGLAAFVGARRGRGSAVLDGPYGRVRCLGAFALPRRAPASRLGPAWAFAACAARWYGGWVLVGFRRLAPRRRPARRGPVSVVAHGTSRPGGPPRSVSSANTSRLHALPGVRQHPARSW